MKSVMMHQFNMVPQANIQRSVFDRSHGYKTTFDADYLIPFYWDEALPGDTFTCKTQALVRLTTPLVPIMDNMYFDTFYFAVPVRLLWENFQRMMGEQDTPGDSTDFNVPIMQDKNGGYGEQSLMDYLGIPPSLESITVSALPVRAYAQIYNAWFRDENLCADLPKNIGAGPDDPDDTPLQKRGKRHDYFTSALKWPQKGTAIDLPLGSTAPVVGQGGSLHLTDGTEDFNVYSNAGTFIVTTAHDGKPSVADTALGDNLSVGIPASSSKAIGLPTGSYTGMVADLTNATAATINSLREAFQLQRLLERDARGGTRYTEIIRSHFGVVSPDARLQRPEYLGGGSQRINVNPVMQTSVTPPNGTGNATPIGHLAAYGVCHDMSGGFTKSFTEHCIVMGIMNVRADLTYSQGINRMWKRRTRWDFYWPALANLGEQEILQQELWAEGIEDDTHDLKVWAYQERYAEYRYYPSMITGKMRVDSATPLDMWHLSEDWASCPALGQTFIEGDLNTTLNRCVAVTTEPKFIADMYISLKCARPMPVYSVPGMIDHF